MSREKVSLVQYREGPSDIEYKPREEMANCNWCRWKELMGCGHPAQKMSPSGFVPGYHTIWNSKGECVRYEVSWFTRLLRKMGLRKEAWK